MRFSIAEGRVIGGGGRQTPEPPVEVDDLKGGA